MYGEGGEMVDPVVRTTQKDSVWVGMDGLAPMLGAPG